MSNSSLQFQKMDELSQRGKPFFFLIDFLAENVEIYEKFELNNLGLSIDFPNVTKVKTTQAKPSEIIWKPQPKSFENYKKGFEIVKKNLLFGNSYLANFTCKTEVETNLNLEDIFSISKAKYKVLYPGKFTFFSPETFVQIIDNEIITFPMKGTIDASVPNAQEILKNDEKEKAEHYTVVDLLRNDLSIVADCVTVSAFQRIDYLQTNQKNLYAMSSEIRGKIKPKFQNKIGSILQNLLPAGSILGAPKKKTLEIVLEAENYERGFYTGISGFFDGKNLDSCVMIRFVEECENGKIYFKSGGGITHKSLAENEYQEMINKIYVPIY